MIVISGPSWVWIPLIYCSIYDICTLDWVCLDMCLNSRVSSRFFLLSQFFFHICQHIQCMFTDFLDYTKCCLFSTPQACLQLACSVECKEGSLIEKLQVLLNKQLELIVALRWENVCGGKWKWRQQIQIKSALRLSCHVSRTTTTALKTATPASCVTATRSALSPERVTERAASVSVNPASLDASVTAVTTPSLRFLPTAVKVRIHLITVKLLSFKM